MSRRLVYHLDHRIIISATEMEAVRSLCSPSGRFTWVRQDIEERRCHDRLRVHTLRGVPGKHVDLLFPETQSVTDQLAGDGITIALEIGKKVGSFDGAIRWRLTFRPWNGRIWDRDRRTQPSHAYPGTGRIIVEEDYDFTVVFVHGDGGMAWTHSFPRLNYEVQTGSRIAILIAQWQGYYTHLPEDEVRQEAEVWDLLPAVQQCQDICALNRMASNFLYDLSRRLGWRKLTLREKRRYGLDPDGPQWRRADSLVLRSPVNIDGSRNGAGEYSNRAAGADQSYIEDYIRTAHGVVDVE